LQQFIRLENKIDREQHNNNKLDGLFSKTPYHHRFHNCMYAVGEDTIPKGLNILDYQIVLIEP